MADESDYGVCSDANEMSLPPCKSRRRTFVVNRSTGADFAFLMISFIMSQGKNAPIFPFREEKWQKKIWPRKVVNIKKYLSGKCQYIAEKCTALWIFFWYEQVFPFLLQRLKNKSKWKFIITDYICYLYIILPQNVRSVYGIPHKYKNSTRQYFQLELIFRRFYFLLFKIVNHTLKLKIERQNFDQFLI